MYRFRVLLVQATSGAEKTYRRVGWGLIDRSLWFDEVEEQDIRLA
jgi:hypothetical protein